MKHQIILWILKIDEDCPMILNFKYFWLFRIILCSTQFMILARKSLEWSFVLFFFLLAIYFFSHWNGQKPSHYHYTHMKNTLCIYQFKISVWIFTTKYVTLTVLANTRKYLKFCYNALGILPKLYIYISAPTKETTQLCQNVFHCLSDTRDLPTVKNRV